MIVIMKSVRVYEIGVMCAKLLCPRIHHIYEIIDTLVSQIVCNNGSGFVS